MIKEIKDAVRRHINSGVSSETFVSDPTRKLDQMTEWIGFPDVLVNNLTLLDAFYQEVCNLV